MYQFRTKARAVDLLGKGQISDLPTAISELWKNGYDAYAKNLEAFFYPEGYHGLKAPIFVIADDGVGMTKDDLMNKWLILGTDSKSRYVEDIKGENTLWQEPRVKMGEKGIGRLSVAYLGSPMLMLTKKRNYPLQALFFDWRMLENFDLFLDDVSIPIESVESIEGFDQTFSTLKTTFLAMLDGTRESWKDQVDIFDKIRSDVIQLELPTFFHSDILSSLFDIDCGGTKFIIFGPDEQLSELPITEGLDYNRRPGYVSKDSAEMTKATLVGLFNAFNGKEPPARTSFIIKGEYGDKDIVASSDFFEPNDFILCDHLIKGGFDEFGNFSGTVRIYKEEVPFVLKNRNPGMEKAYGPFSIKVGYVPGDSSGMEQDSLRLMNDKLKRFGGLYIYRDDYRVLPYGKTEFDFLNFEKRRTFGAGAYFFSHRRMFGCIEISRKNNENLKDKAGREGFISNRAYREFQSDLENLFIVLASEYFGSNAKSDLKQNQQDMLEREREMLSMEEKRSQKERKDFNDMLKSSPDSFTKLSSNIRGLFGELKRNVSKSEIVFEEIQGMLADIGNYQNEIKSLTIKKPTRFSISESQAKKLFDFNSTIQSFQDIELIEIQKLVDEARIRLKDAELLKEYDNRGEYFKNVISTSFNDYRDDIGNAAKLIVSLLDNERTESISQVENLVVAHRPSSEDTVEIAKNVAELEVEFGVLRAKINERITPVIAFLNSLSFDINDNELVGFYKLRFEEIEKQWRKTREMAQIGIAMEIIDHQFYALYSQLSHGIKSIADHISEDEVPQRIIRDIGATFTHLEELYKFMSPIYRSTRKTKRELSGNDIYAYVQTFFSEQLSKNEITLEMSDSFKDFQINTFASILLPVFINIVNNAIYWLSGVERRIIRFDYIEGRILIINSGEKIEDFYLDKIFDLFYSRRQEGRGIGLYLAKENLSDIGFDILATNDPKYNRFNGACFVIQSPNRI